jgi:hypothetical protein
MSGDSARLPSRSSDTHLAAHPFPSFTRKGSKVQRAEQRIVDRVAKFLDAALAVLPSRGPFDKGVIAVGSDGKEPHLADVARHLFGREELYQPAFGPDI